MPDRTALQKIGDMGESVAARQLEIAGFDLLERNYHTRFGEIDIIAANDEYIVFVEVKTRSLGAFDRPAAAVNKAKQKKLIRTAMIYLEGFEGELTPRFDVIEVVFDDNTGSVVDINHIENAFILSDNIFDTDL